ncbi:MAG TPA: hypothetical protein VKT82_33525 [Ktedonobacterales bacterium]|nr:hypothetical protein [Ktedonobacterales bacterium]
MYARVTSGQLHPDKIDEASRMYEESIVPALKQAKGFKALLALTNRATGKGLVIAMWETEAEMQASQTSGLYQEQMMKMAHVLVGMPSFETYEVMAQV